MPALPLSEFAAALPEHGALLGVDPGEKRIGLAVSDAGRRIASPVAILARGKFATVGAEILALYRDRGCAGVVVGLPLELSGRAGPAAQAARAFARNLLAMHDAPLLFWDERLSTAAVTRMLIDADASRKRRLEVTDKLAAAYVLQGALERLWALEDE